ncbi:hypothetical protein JCM3766R1_000417 [Sporobolomyces carnicolor]
MASPTRIGAYTPTILLPVTASTATLSSLRQALLSALESSSGSEPPELWQDHLGGPIPTTSEDIALWRLEPREDDAAPDANENWIRLTDEKSTADKFGLQEADQVGVSFRSQDGEFPQPSVIRPKDDYEEGDEE